jgi:hypothetical protein
MRLDTRLTSRLFWRRRFTLRLRHGVFDRAKRDLHSWGTSPCFRDSSAGVA